jgi:hypothetical protein
LQNFEAEAAGDTVRHTDQNAEQEQAEFVGDMPDDAEEAVHHRPEEDQ